MPVTLQKHILMILIVTLIGVTLVFTPQFGLLPSFFFALILCLTTFALGAIAVKVMGETSIEPVSGTSFIVLLMLVLLLLVQVAMLLMHTLCFDYIG